MATIASLNVALSADSARLKRDLDRAGRTTQSWADRQKARFRGVSGAARGMATAMAGIAAAMGTKKLLDNADALGKNAAAAGLSVEAYQRLQFGFGQAGISQAGFEKGQKTLNKIFADAGDGMSTAVDALEAVGLTYEDLAAMAPEERMLAVARGLDEIEDAGLRSAAATELMGKEMGTVRLDADQIIADGEGISVVTEEAALGAADMNDAMSRISTTMSNLTTNAIVPMLAAMEPLINSIAQFAQDNPAMASALAGLLALGAAIAVAGAPITILVGAVVGAIAVFQNWDEIVGYLSDTWGAFGDKFPMVASGIEGALDGLAAPFLMIKDVVGAIFELFTGEGSFLDRLKAFGGNIVDALVTNNPVVQLMGSLADVLKVPLNAVIGLFENMVNRVIDTINDITSFSFEIPFYGTYSTTGANLQPFDLPAFATGGYVSGAGNGTSDSIPAMLSDGEFVINAAATSKFGPLLEQINSGSFGAFATGGAVSSSPRPQGRPSGGSSEKSVYEQIADTFVDGLKSSFTTALSTGDWKGFLDSVLDSFTMGVISSFTEGLFAPLQDAIGGFVEGLFSGMGGGGGSIVDGLGSIFGFAEGGIVPTTSTSKSYADSVPAMLQPGELVVPKSQVDNFMNGASGGGGQTFNINVTGDVSRLTRSEIVKMMPEIAAGTNMLNKENGRR